MLGRERGKRERTKITVEVVLPLCDVQLLELIPSLVCKSEHFSNHQNLDRFAMSIPFLFLFNY